MNPSLIQLLALLEEAFHRQSWHGPTLLGSIRGVRVERASWRPAPKRHNIWELAVHAAYWKYAVRRHITGEARGSFAYPGSNWFDRPGADGVDERAWKKDVRLLVEEHRRLRAAVASIAPRALTRKVPGKAYSIAFLVRGIAAHDLYHAGQVQLLKKLQGGS